MSSMQELASDRNRLKFEYKKAFHSDKIRNAFKFKRYLLKINNNKKLKRKLTKYKLRQDGQEDQDVIDVSHTLLSILKIRSPNKLNSYQEIDPVIVDKPTNYIMKMVRKKLNQVNSKDVSEKEVIPDCQDATIEVSLEAQNKKEVNAFKLMMDSRHKIIGTNSPGKEREFSDIESQDLHKDKEIKVKRNLMLQKLAEAKGSLKQKERDEKHEKYIETQMRKRVKRFKSMIINSNSKHSTLNQRVQEQNSVHDIVKEEPKKLCFINILKDESSLTNVTLSNEDEEFLKKLSPSMRKKENMLCYFTKLTKDSVLAEPNNEIFTHLDSDTNRIKVKLPSKKKKKKKASRHSFTNYSKDNDAISTNSIDIKMIENCTHNIDGDTQNNKATSNENVPTESNNSSRSKRCIKRPIKYVDNIVLSSSDSDEPIFTPKKRKSNFETATNTSRQNKNLCHHTKVVDEDKKKVKKVQSLKNLPDKSLVLAPIFKTNYNNVVNEERIKFLNSGVPEKLKKKVDKNKICQQLSSNFPTVVHVQQISKQYDRITSFSLPGKYIAEDIILEKYHSYFQNLLVSPSIQPVVLTVPKYNITTVLQNIKQSYPKFPVYRTYKSLKNKSIGAYNDKKYPEMDNSIEIINNMSDILSENVENLDWPLKYRPTSANEIIGNFDSVRELKKWLTSWTENDNIKPTKKQESDSSDFYCSDSDSRGEFNSINNFLILTGPVGSGKTSSVYAIAAELSIKVIEVNASSKRTGKIMLQDLQEATQSHKVNRGKGSSTENSQMSLEIIVSKKFTTNKKRGRPKKYSNSICSNENKIKQMSQQSSQESVRTCMSLILIDDADIVFDQDDGFCAAIAQLIQCSKRPVILVSESTSCQHLRRFTRHGKIIRFKSFLPKMLGTWLDIMCLAESGLCYPGTGAKALEFYNGDIRKTIHFLHFYISTQSQIITPNNLSQTADDKEIEDTNESSCKSWNYIENSVEHSVMPNQESSMWNYISEQNLLLDHAANSINLWQNMPSIYSNSDMKSERKFSEIVKLYNIAFTMDNISLTDVLDHRKDLSRKDLLFQSKPWFACQRDSLSENENMESVNKNVDLGSDIGCSIVSSTASHIIDVFGYENSICKTFSCSNIQRKQEELYSRHNTLTDSVNPAAILDRRALALDYWSACRTICKIEKNKSDGNYRRNNRYCHYLKSLNVMCKNDTFDNLADSLPYSDNTG